MKAKRSSQFSLFLIATIFSSFVYSAQEKVLMPVTDLENKNGTLAHKLFEKGVNGLSIEKYSSVVDSKALASEQAPSVPCPTNKAGLTDGYQLFTYSLTNDAASSLSLWAKAEIKASDKVVLYQFAWYKDLLNADGSINARCGSGVMLALKISDANVDMSLELPTLAATAQLGRSFITYKLNTFGLSGSAIDASIPNAASIGKFDTESYAALMQSIGKVQDSYKAAANELVVTPRLIAISYPSLPQNFEKNIVIQAYSLRQIAAGKTCREAKSNSPDKDSIVSSVIENVYLSFAGKNCSAFSGAPSADIKRKATDILTLYGLQTI